MESKVLRYFTIKGENLVMYSAIEGEFAQHRLRTSACVAAPFVRGGQEGEDQMFPGVSIWQDCDSDLTPFDFRLGEMAYFLQVLSMFNPKNKSDYEVSSSPSQEQL